MDINFNNISSALPGHSMEQPVAPQAPVVASLPRRVESEPTLQKLSALSNKEFEKLVERGEAQMQEAFTVNRSTFTLFKLPDGKTYSRVRDLDTGEITYFPSLDAFSYNRALEADTGSLVEKTV